MENISKSVVKKDHLPKITGRSCYVGDYTGDILTGKWSFFTTDWVIFSMKIKPPISFFHISLCIFCSLPGYPDPSTRPHHPQPRW